MQHTKANIFYFNQTPLVTDQAVAKILANN